MPGFFDHLQTKGSVTIRPQRPQIRKVETKSSPAPKIAPSSSSVSSISKAHRSPNSSSPSRARSSRGASAASDRLTPNKDSSRKSTKSRSQTRKRPSPVQRLSSDDESDTEASFETNKRVRLRSSPVPDLQRQVRCKESFWENGDRDLSMIHAADITSNQKPAEFDNAFEEDGTPSTVQLKYPGSSQKET